MYKFLLCWRYLRTRYIALASIVSVTLGVATMIVVNAVMAGFTVKMQDRIHGILSDLDVQSHSLGGFYDPKRVMDQIRDVAGDDIECMTPIVQVPAMLSHRYGSQTVTRQVMLVGIDPECHAAASDFGKYLLHPGNRQKFSFELREGGWDTRDHQAGERAPERPDLKLAGWPYRRWWAERDRVRAEQEAKYRDWKGRAKRPGPTSANDGANEPPTDESASEQPAPDESTRENEASGASPVDGEPDPTELAEDAASPSGEPRAEPAPGPVTSDANSPLAMFNDRAQSATEKVFDPRTRQHTGIVLGIALATYANGPQGENFLLLPGDDVQLTLPTAGTPPRAVDERFTVVDFYESKMSEYDSNLVFVPIDRLQELRGMIDPESGVGYASSIQIKLKDESRGIAVRDKLRNARYTDPDTGTEYALFPPDVFGIYTWRDKQGPLLAAVQMETAILNVLLFMIIAVAGFGILAIFFMIVVEKTRDIGILKSLGASATGVMGIFLTYGLSLGTVGAGVGLFLGLLIVGNLNPISDVLSWFTGHKVFDPSIYYFYEIPSIIQPFTVGWIVTGAMLIAVLASVFPALRAARLHPVEALRYE